jgi:putative transposase
MSTVKRTWSIEEKVSILKDIKKIGVVEGCRKHGIYATTYYDWKKKYEEKGADGLVPRYGRKESGELKKVQKENERLKKLLAEKELELSIKTDLLKKKMAQWKSAKK